jgi:hypothetical protein
MSFTDITIENYSERSFVVRGDTRAYKESLKKLGGKYNSRLRDGPGWIFPMTLKKDVESFKRSGQHLVSEDERKDGERRTREWEEKRESGNVRSSGDNVLHKEVMEMKKLLRSLVQLVTKQQKTIDDLVNMLSEEENPPPPPSTTPTNIEEEEEEEEEEEKAPTKRLLR